MSTPIWLTRVWFPIRHPRQALCDCGLWKCHQHPRMLWLTSDRRWAWRHRLRARRVARYTGWAPGELQTHLDRERRALCERLAADMAALVARHWKDRVIHGLAPSLTLHTHGPEVACLETASGCMVYPATETVSTIFPPLMTTMRELEGLDFIPAFGAPGVSVIDIDHERYRW